MKPGAALLCVNSAQERGLWNNLTESTDLTSPAVEARRGEGAVHVHRSIRWTSRTHMQSTGSNPFSQDTSAARDQSGFSVKDWFKFYKSHGWSTVPLPPLQKRPVIKGWNDPSRRFSEADFSED